MDGVSQVQARISEIQARFLIPGPPTASSGDWASAAVGRGADRHERRPRRAARPAAPRRRPPSWPRRRSTSACPTCGAAPTRARGWTAPASPSWSSATSASTCRGCPRSRPPPAGRSPRWPTPAPATWSSSTTPRRRAGIDHVGIYIGNGKMIAAPQPGESVKVQDVGNPVGDPPGAARADRRPATTGGDRVRAGRRALRRPVHPRRPAGTAWTPSLLAAVARRSRASTRRRSPRPAPRASCSSCRRPPPASG